MRDFDKLDFKELQLEIRDKLKEKSNLKGSVTILPGFIFLPFSKKGKANLINMPMTLPCVGVSDDKSGQITLFSIGKLFDDIDLDGT